MSAQINQLPKCNPEPLYFHRECKNDFPEKKVPPKERTWIDDAQRVTLVALPFLSLHRPFSFPIALGTGTLRTWTCFSELLGAALNGDPKNSLYALLQTAIAVTSLACTILAHPLGMIVTTGHDLAIEVYRLIQHIGAGESEKAIGSCLSILNNALYFSMMLHGGLELAVASLAMQILVGLHQSRTEFKNGNLLEGVAHLAMGAIRTKQLTNQVEALKSKWELEASLKRGREPGTKSLHSASSNIKTLHLASKGPKSVKFSDLELMERAKTQGNQDLIDILTKYRTGKYSHALYNALQSKDYRAVKVLIQNHARVEYNSGIHRSPGTTPPPFEVPVLEVALLNTDIPYDLVKDLIKNGAVINYELQTTYSILSPLPNRPALIRAAESNRLDLMQLLLESGADVHAEFPWNQYRRVTVVGHLCKYLHDDLSKMTQRAEMVELLLEWGADPNQLNPLYHATEGAYLSSKEKIDFMKVVELLLEYGADMNQVYHFRSPDSTYAQTPYESASWAAQYANSPDLLEIFERYREIDLL